MYNSFDPQSFFGGLLNRISMIWSLSVINSFYGLYGDQKKLKLWLKVIIRFEPFSEAPNKKLEMKNDGLEPTKLFTCSKIYKIISKRYGFLQNNLRDFLFLHYFPYFDISENALPIIETSVGWSVKNNKSEMYIFLFLQFPLCFTKQ